MREPIREPWKDQHLDQAVKSLKSLKIGMTDASRRHLALQCRQTRPSPLGALGILLGGLRPSRLPIAAGVMAVFVAVGVAALTMGHRVPTLPEGPGQSPVRLVSVVPAASGGVTLEWRDGLQRTYTVRKSTDPRNFNNAETYAVRGNQWTDPAPTRGEVVYYKVE